MPHAEGYKGDAKVPLSSPSGEGSLVVVFGSIISSPSKSPQA
jgi:hypothetical protein